MGIGQNLLKSLFRTPTANNGDTLVISTVEKDDDIVVESVSSVTVDTSTQHTTQELPNEVPQDNFFSKQIDNASPPPESKIIAAIDKSLELAGNSDEELTQLLRGIAVEIYQDQSRRDLLAKAIAIRLRGHLGIKAESQQTDVNDLAAQFFKSLKQIVKNLPGEQNV